jgi:hypothetical protein
MGVFAVVAASSCAFAQTAPENPAASGSAGLLGFRYAEANVGIVDLNHTDVSLYGIGGTVNLPVAPNFDVSLDYAYSWTNHNTSFHANAISATGIYYVETAAGVKAFGGLSLGYDWSRWYGSNDDRATWGAVAGLEYQVTQQFVLTVSAGYDDDFKSGDNSSFDGTVAGHYWITKQIALSAEVSLIEGGNVGYAVGATFRF